MFLKTLGYEEFQGQPKNWKIEQTDFGNINLVVGKNSSGKTRLLNIVSGLAKLVSGRIQPKFTSGTWDCLFERAKGQATESQRYYLELNNSIVASEKFSVRRSQIMERNAEGVGFVVKKSNDARIRYKVPLDQLMAVVRRDELQHPQFDQLYEWGKKLCIYRFGSDLGRNNIVVTGQTEPVADLQLSDQEENAALVFKRTSERFGEVFKSKILSDLREVGFPCRDIGLSNPPTSIVFGEPPAFLAILEEGVQAPIAQNDMSQGMYRALAVIIQVNANILWAQSRKVGRQLMAGDSPMVVIDDIGEGLDFSRSRALVGLLIRAAKEHQFQLLMSSNDRFIMNDVPLEHWTILHRQGSVVRAFNNQNSGEVFKDFQFLGLNNFDFFASESFLQKAE
jgi:energy-coupling factor transporter ATP-binding protein EcfA2